MFLMKIDGCHGRLIFKIYNILSLLLSKERVLITKLLNFISQYTVHVKNLIPKSEFFR